MCTPALLGARAQLGIPHLLRLLRSKGRDGWNCSPAPTWLSGTQGHTTLRECCCQGGLAPPGTPAAPLCFVLEVGTGSREDRGWGVLTPKRDRSPSGAETPLCACDASKGPHKVPRVPREAQDVLYLSLLFQPKFCLLLTSEKGERELQPPGKARCSSWGWGGTEPDKTAFPLQLAVCQSC